MALLVVSSSHCIVANIFHGIIWYYFDRLLLLLVLLMNFEWIIILNDFKIIIFANTRIWISCKIISLLFYILNRIILPCSLIIINDTFAYLFGFFFGRTRLIKLSPKKTWEGFLGGGLATSVLGMLVCSRIHFVLFSRFWSILFSVLNFYFSYSRFLLFTQSLTKSSRSSNFPRKY